MPKTGSNWQEGAVLPGGLPWQWHLKWVISNRKEAAYRVGCSGRESDRRHAGRVKGPRVLGVHGLEDGMKEGRSGLWNQEGRSLWKELLAKFCCMRNEETERRENCSCFWKDNWNCNVQHANGWWWCVCVCVRERQRERERGRTAVGKQEEGKPRKSVFSKTLVSVIGFWNESVGFRRDVGEHWPWHLEANPAAPISTLCIQHERYWDDPKL